MQNAAYWIRPAWRRPRMFTKIVRIVKLSMLLLTAAFLQVQATGLSQSVTLSGNNLEVKKVFATIRQQTGYVVFYRKGLLADAKPISVAVHDMPLTEFLDLVLKNQPFTYLILDRTISLSRKPEPSVITRPAPSVDTTAPKPQLFPLIGRVLDENGNPLIGASVMIKNTATSVMTRDGGLFDLKVRPGQTVIISYVGYSPQQVRLTADNIESLNKAFVVRLQPGNSDLDQVQVLAHGTTSKRLNPGDVTTITSEQIAMNPVANVMQAVQGNAPGLFIQQTTGQPGGAFNLNVRGAANLTSGLIAPLVIVDGIRYPAGTLPTNSYSQLSTEAFLGGGSGLNYINPNDIERIDILKDADATAIYGSSGAYGVILITTKKAKAGQATLDVNVYEGVSIKGEMPKLLNTPEYVGLRAEAIKNDGLTIGKGDLDVNGTWPTNRYTDWRKIYLGAEANTENANISYGGGNRNTTYRINGSYQSIGDIQLHKGIDVNGGLGFSLTTRTEDNKLELDFAGSYLASKNTMIPYDFSSGSTEDAPNAPGPFNANGTINWNTDDPNLTQVANNLYRIEDNVTNNLIANGTLVYKPIPSVTLRAIIGYNDMTSKEWTELPTTTFAPTSTSAAASTQSIFNNYDMRSLTAAPYAEYDKTLWRKNDLSVKVGGELDEQTTYQYNIRGTGFPSDALLNDPAAGATIVNTYSETPFRDLGFYGIVKDVWDQKYILDLNGRRDGSTKFAPGDRWGNFGSIGAAWIFTQENWVKGHLPWLSFGKLRGSDGIVGGDAIAAYQYLSIYDALTGTYDGKIGLTPTGLTNPNLKWEQNKDKEIGIELGFFKYRIFTQASYYHNVVSNQLVGRPVSSVTGFSSLTLNSDAVIRNTGWEFILNTRNIVSRNFTWTTRFNISIPANKLLKLPTLANQNTNFILGKPVTGLKLYKYAGVDSATGYMSYTNAKGVTYDYPKLPAMGQADETQWVNTAPKFYGGVTNSFTYKQFSLDVQFSFIDRVGKNWLAQSNTAFGYFDFNGSTQWLNRWQKPGDKTSVPKVSTNVFTDLLSLGTFQNSNGAYTSATYARLQNLSFRYNFSKEMLRKMHLKGCMLYLQGQNLLTISKYGGLDPENLNASVIPPLRTFTGGINLSL
jgi:TonB-linked SusC/RagA family outer membrane protein